MTEPKPTRSLTPASRRYTIRFSIGMALYLVTLFVAVALRNAGVGGDTPWLLGMITLPAVGIVTWALVAFYRESDEFEQRKLGDSFVCAFGLGVPLLLTIGLLESFGGPHLNWMLAFSIMMAAWLVGSLVANLRYR